MYIDKLKIDLFKKINREFCFQAGYSAENVILTGISLSK